MNRVGQPAAPLQRPVYRKGENYCLQLQEDRPQESDPVWVGRHGDGWVPVSLEQVKTALSQGTATAQLGLWRDSRRYLILPPDGRVQNHEVQTLADRWQESHLCESRITRTLGGRESQYVTHYAQVEPGAVHINEQGFLVEPRQIHRSELHTATGWSHNRRVGQYATGWSTEVWHR